MRYPTLLASALLMAFFAGGCTADSPNPSEENTAMNEKFN